ncbi:putative alpha,alpha-trehalose-phosphate synthase [UDP-forming] 106 kDa subunit-like protein [Hapsidospora chrysogenum ATCC 11550]|uniref:Putative alpha,alpha-trehalose-phosphate synthase [UDP-forming] 106 kDa subunit-like protein n=1 Tax=Hapsidospora chrysogenum (strain ATCC 11550 / CBS 779.69 / DSM 880 / IAM 14645 / JCM 23072 / IMI 49137) TaxID=857340 RepID=A0A086TH05_HAPC1|nr:putative alpha,alpha-trehalose-phosphate synthase [UDP-forming] 106 kDa subunit-like protein [Hapsidospora chrysogenum ATCC 11550]
MTVFICSLFLPKTVYFNLPGSPQDRPGLERRTTTTLPVHPPKPAVPTEATPSLFTPRPDFTPPQTPTYEENQPDFFGNEDGFRVPFPHDLGSPTDNSTSAWGGRANQPRSHANSPPPKAISEHARTLEKARELGRQGVIQPKPLVRSESHDRVFSNAHWKVVDADQGNGGLRNAALAAAREYPDRDHIWVGTLGMPTDAIEGTQQKEEIEDTLATEHDMLTVFCPDKVFDGHYNHFCKQILWPVFHYQIPDNPKSKAYEDHSWKYYVNVNRAFADKIIKNWKRGDVVWIHDYHLLLVPGMVREKLPEAQIGFFLHVAFPSSEVFRCLAVRKELLEGILGANLIGFQIEEYTRHFLQTCSRILSVEATPEGIHLEDRFVDVTNLAIGIDPVSLNKHRLDENVARWLSILKERYQGKKLIVARDKLDLIRGVRQKLLSYELFLKKYPEWSGNTILIQVALSASEKGNLDVTVSDIVSRVNSKRSNLAYQPVVYLKQDIDYAQYLALLAIADVLMITSQREGMNLTSHEYLFCQDGSMISEKKHGSLILSEFTGTASLFNKNELSINPWDYHQCADAIQQALKMSDEEKKERWEKLYGAVAHHTGSLWFNEFLSRLDTVYKEQNKRDQTAVPRLSIQTLSAKYKNSERRLFILDYEGTLVSWGPLNQIIPVSPQRTLDILNDLVLDERNTVYIMSGRRPEELERVFRRVPNIGLIAENGCFVKEFYSDEWAEMADQEETKKWKDSVRPILTYFLERTPGAEIEERHCSILFHYKDAEDPELAARQAAECASHVNDACESQRVHAVPMEHSIAVEPVDWTKKTAAGKVFDMLSSEKELKPVDFLMVVGDGREDEKVFKWANWLGKEKVKEVTTVSVGSRSTEATATVTHGVSGVLTCLQRLAAQS